MPIDFERYQGATGDGLNTYEWTAYQREYKKAQYLAGFTPSREHVIDPFARNCPWGTIRNDLDPDMPTHYHMDAADFMEEMECKRLMGGMDLPVGIVLFDPPFSARQAERYEVGDQNLYTTTDGRIGRIGASSVALLKPGGIFLKLGYNTVRPAVGLTLVRVAIATFGGNRNDVIFSHWQRMNYRLEDFSIGNERGGV